MTASSSSLHFILRILDLRYTSGSFFSLFGMKKCLSSKIAYLKATVKRAITKWIKDHSIFQLRAWFSGKKQIFFIIQIVFSKCGTLFGLIMSPIHSLFELFVSSLELISFRAIFLFNFNLVFVLLFSFAVHYCYLFAYSKSLVGVVEMQTKSIRLVGSHPKPTY